MTAIDKFIRLEAVGFWLEQGQEEAREVIVSFGDSTLQLTSLQDVPLTHWSLLATSPIGTRGETVIYSADPEHRETLEIDDQDMIRAISAVSSALGSPREKKLWGRWIWRGMTLAILLVAVIQSPPAIYSLASTITPPARMAEVSEQMLDNLESEFGDECQGWLGKRALDEFAGKLFPNTTPDISVIEGLPTPAMALPANKIVLSRQAIEQSATPDELATLTLRAWAHAANDGPKDTLIKSLGPIGALRYMISGTFPLPLPTLPEPEYSGEDYLLARDQLVVIGASANSLQAMATEDVIGLPLPDSNLPPFAFSDFATLKTICAD